MAIQPDMIDGTGATATVSKNKARFMTGYNAGSRHAKLSITPSDFKISEMSADFQMGYQFGFQDRRSGRLTDNDAATMCINEAWRIYNNGGSPDKLVLTN